MARAPVEIDKPSARSLAKWRIQQILDGGVGFFRELALKAALKDGGGVDEISDMLYDMGIRLSIDENNPDHKKWLEAKAAIRANE